MYKVTLVLYKYDQKYYILTEKKTNKKIFTSDDNINYRIKFQLFIKNNNFQKPINEQLQVSEPVDDLTNLLDDLHLSESDSDVIIENRNRHVGKVIFIKNDLPVVVCQKGLIQLVDIKDNKNNRIHPRFRSRFSSSLDSK